METETADGKYIVVENGRRVTGPITSREDAQKEADKRNKLSESGGQPVPEHQRAAVKQVIMG